MKLLAFGGFPHDPQSVLAAVQRDTFVSVKCKFNLELRINLRGSAKLELGITALADTNRWQRVFDDSELAASHGLSLAHLAGRV